MTSRPDLTASIHDFEGRDAAERASVGYQGKLFVATACYYEAPCPTAASIVWRYDPVTDQWTKFAERDRDWWDVSAGLIGGRLYLVEEFTGALDILDLATGTWSSGPKRPFRACSAAATSLQAKLYLFGYCDDYPTDPVTRDRGLVFDPGSNTWSEVPPVPITAAADASLAKVFVNGNPRCRWWRAIDRTTTSSSCPDLSSRPA